MKRFAFSFLVFPIFLLLSSCNFIGNSIKYDNTSKEFVDDLLQKDYDKCVGLMAMNHPAAAHTNIDTLKSGFAQFRNLIVNNFGDKLEYKFMSAEKIWSPNKGESTSPNTTKVFLQFSNKREFGVFEFLFDDKSRKILNIQVLDIKRPVPGMTLFWLAGLLAISVPVFNIYMIVKVKRSGLRRKWLSYLAIIIFNVPTIAYKAIGGLSLQLLSFQILLGIGINYMGYIHAAWSVGIPLGGLFILWRLWKGKDKSGEINPVDLSVTETGDTTLLSEGS